MSDSTPVTTSDQDVLITRIFDAPREQVFKAWTDPDEVAVWYGPGHMDVPREKVRIDPRVGGRWEITMVQRGGGMEFAIGYESSSSSSRSSSSCARTRCQTRGCTSPLSCE